MEDRKAGTDGINFDMRKVNLKQPAVKKNVLSGTDCFNQIRFALFIWLVQLRPYGALTTILPQRHGSQCLWNIPGFWWASTVDI